MRVLNPICEHLITLLPFKVGCCYRIALGESAKRPQRFNCGEWAGFDRCREFAKGAITHRPSGPATGRPFQRTKQCVELPLVFSLSPHQRADVDLTLDLNRLCFSAIQTPAEAIREGTDSVGVCRRVVSQIPHSLPVGHLDSVPGWRFVEVGSERLGFDNCPGRSAFRYLPRIEHIVRPVPQVTFLAADVRCLIEVEHQRVDELQPRVFFRVLILRMQASQDAIPVSESGNQFGFTRHRARMIQEYPASAPRAQHVASRAPIRCEA